MPPISWGDSEATGSAEPSLPAPSLRLSVGAQGCPFFLFPSGHPQRGSLAASSTTVQLPPFGSLYILLQSLYSTSHTPSDQPHVFPWGPSARLSSLALHSDLGQAGRGYCPTKLSAHIPLPGRLPPPVTLTFSSLSCPWPVCCHFCVTFWSFNMSHQGLDGIGGRSLWLGKKTLCFSASIFRIYFPLLSLSLPSRRGFLD